jgi:hypothetical protein
MHGKSGMRKLTYTERADISTLPWAARMLVRYTYTVAVGTAGGQGPCQEPNHSHVRRLICIPPEHMIIMNFSILSSGSIRPEWVMTFVVQMRPMIGPSMISKAAGFSGVRNQPYQQPVSMQPC